MNTIEWQLRETSPEAPASREANEASEPHSSPEGTASGAEGQKNKGPEQNPIRVLLKDSRNTTRASAERAGQTARADELERKVVASTHQAGVCKR